MLFRRIAAAVGAVALAVGLAVSGQGTAQAAT